MTALPITLGLPPLEPIEAPPACCPHCGGKRATDDQDDVASYACGAFYIFMQGTDGESPAWIAHRDCPTPRAAAVLAALVENGGVPMQRIIDTDELLGCARELRSEGL